MLPALLHSRTCRLLLTVLIALGMHLCCCHFGHAAADGHAAHHITELGHGHDHDHFHDHSGGCDEAPAPSDHPEPPAHHDCCGGHAKPMSLGGSTLRITPPSAVLFALLPPPSMIDQDLAAALARGNGGVHRADRGGGLMHGAPPIDGSLLRARCAFTI